jgi:hypothetical protein
MKRLLPILALLSIGLSACLKDEVDVATLTTNGLDPDYSGPAIIDLISDTTIILYDQQNQPVDTVVRQLVRVNETLLPPGTIWDLYIVKENTNEIIDYTSDIPQPDSTYHHVQLGTDYCYTYQLKVQYSLTKAYRYCTTAAL